MRSGKRTQHGSYVPKGKTKEKFPSAKNIANYKQIQKRIGKAIRGKKKA